MIKTFRRRPTSIWLRRALFQVHLWVGLVFGLYVLVISVTGAALVFRINLQRAWHPGLFTPSAVGPMIQPEAVLDRLQQAYPTFRISGVDAPTTARPTYLAYVTSGPRFVTVLIDPVTGDILGELPERSPVRTLQDLHFDLLAGRTGRTVNGVGAVALLLMCATGLMIWWPGTSRWRRGFTIDWRRSWPRLTWDFHSVVGIGTAGILVIWAVTGLYFVFPSSFRTVVQRGSPITARRPPSSAAATDTVSRPTWHGLIDRARERSPQGYVARVVLPANEKAAFLVQFAAVSPTPVGADLSSVYLDQFTGEKLADASSGRRTFGDLVIAWVGPLHVGSFGGVGVKAVWFVLGLSPALLFVTGSAMWWTRVLRKRRQPPRQHTDPRRPESRGALPARTSGLHR
jgi:uncharacterized iron-regulated membrane protein